MGIFLVAVHYTSLVYIILSETFLILDIELFLWSGWCWILISDILMLFTLFVKAQLGFFTNKNCVIVYACIWLNYKIIEYMLHKVIIA